MGCCRRNASICCQVASSRTTQSWWRRTINCGLRAGAEDGGAGTERRVDEVGLVPIRGADAMEDEPGKLGHPSVGGLLMDGLVPPVLALYFGDERRVGGPSRTVSRTYEDEAPSSRTPRWPTQVRTPSTSGGPKSDASERVLWPGVCARALLQALQEGLEGR
jgi:hypothetical protein